MSSNQPENTTGTPHDAPPMWQIALLSFLLVLFFAGPSYMLASSDRVHLAGLWLPMVGMFLLLLALGGLPELRRQLGTRTMRRAVIYVLFVRIVSLCLLIGFGLDILLGVITLRITEIICGRGGMPILNWLDDFTRVNTTNQPDFLPTFIATCIQGMLLFFAFFIVLLMALPIARYQVNKQSNATYACCQCGYDLRMTPTRCPECGTEPTDEQRDFLNQQNATVTA